MYGEFMDDFFERTQRILEKYTEVLTDLFAEYESEDFKEKLENLKSWFSGEIRSIFLACQANSETEMKIVDVTVRKFSVTEKGELQAVVTCPDSDENVLHIRHMRSQVCKLFNPQPELDFSMQADETLPKQEELEGE